MKIIIDTDPQSVKIESNNSVVPYYGLSKASISEIKEFINKQLVWVRWETKD